MKLLTAVLLGGGSLAILVGFQPKAFSEKQYKAMTDDMIKQKNIALASIMYAADFDDVLMCGPSEKDMRSQAQPYLKDPVSSWKPASVGQFQFAQNIRTAVLQSIPNPANSVLNFQTQPAWDGLRSVAFIDGNVKRLDAKAWAKAKASLQAKYRLAKKN